MNPAVKNSTVTYQWRKIWEIVGPELLGGDLPASVAEIKSERNELREHMTNLRASNQQLITHKKELQRQLSVCRKALEELSRHYPNYNPGIVTNVVTEALNQLPESETNNDWLSDWSKP